MRIIVIGCGRVGSGLALILSQRGHIVTVIDKERSVLDRFQLGFTGRLIEGIGFDEAVLRQAGIERADALAAVTNSDETNVVAANIARRFFEVPNVVARIHDPKQAEIYSRLGLKTVAPTTWGVSRFADLLCHAEQDVVMSLGNGELDIIREEVPPTLAGRTVQDLTVLGEVMVTAIVRNGKAFVPTLGTVFQAGDTLYVASMANGAERLSQFIQSG